jgi:hypothetical protein
MSFSQPSQITCEMGVYIGVAIQASKAIGHKKINDNDLRMALIMDRFSSAEIEREFAAAKAIADGAS